VLDTVGGGDEGEEEEEEEEGSSPSCADLAQLDPALAEGCQSVLDTVGVPA
jgi:hypothetical protein